MRCRPTVAVALLTAGVLLSMASSDGHLAAEQPDAQAMRHLSAGEFHLARRAVGQLPEQQRGTVLAQIALGQAAAGDAVGSSQTVLEISDSAARNDALRDLGAGYDPGTGTGGAGGGSMADFATLMQLISTTVTPDTWEQLGGPSTMSPYPGGIYVDGEGVIRETIGQAAGDPLPAIGQLLQSGEAADAATKNRDWTAAAELRFVSLRRLASELVRLRINCLPLPPSMQHLAGISEVRYLIIDRRGDDVLLAGPVGGIDLASGWPQDRHSGQTALQLPYLTATLHAALDGQPLGCSIDPTSDSISAALDVAQQIGDRAIPLVHAAERLSQALGRQQVTVFGTAGDTPLAWLLLDADRHMKQLALGQHPMPEGVPNYLDLVDAHIAAGPPDSGQLLRMWFTAAPISVRASADRSVFQLAGLPLQLATENQVSGDQGQRQVIEDDRRAVEFADQFNEHFSQIATQYPVYAALASVFRTAGVAALLTRHAEPSWVHQVCGPLLDEGLIWPHRVPAPRQVDSIAVMHQVRHAGKRHHVLLASGGVSIDPAAVVGGSADGSYAPLASTPPVAADRPAAVQRWWWDIR